MGSAAIVDNCLFIKYRESGCMELCFETLFALFLKRLSNSCLAMVANMHYSYAENEL